jgi:DNA-binding PadR family transcriptional regulator
MYELFILGKLMHRPIHGYLLQSIINAALGPFRRLGWGTLYPLLRKLEQGGLIAVQGDKSGDRRGTKNYRTTPRGRARFFELMRSASEHDTEYRDLFRVKLSNFGHIGREDQQLILAEYRKHMEAVVRHSEAKAGEVLKAPGLAAAERPYVLKAIDHQRHLATSEITWVDALNQEIGGKGEDGLAKDGRAASKSAGDRRRRVGTRPRSDPRK